MRIILIFFGISFFVFFGLQLGLNYFFPPYQTVASDFFSSISKKEYKNAYSLLSTDFKKQIDFEHFQNFIDNSEYKNYSSAKWFDVKMGDTQGSMDGIIILKSFKQIPLHFTFVKERETELPVMPVDVSNEVKKAIGSFVTWKINEISTPGSTSSNTSTSLDSH